MAKLFCDIIKDATVSSVHVSTDIGNSTQSRRDRKRRAANRVMAQTSEATAIKSPDVSLREEQDDVVHGARKNAWTLPLDIKKADVDQRLIFGWASVVEKNGQLVVDKQGDIIPVTELENAAYQFALDSRDGGDMHSRTGVARLVESMVFTQEKQKVIGVDIGQVGWWVGFKVDDDELWAAHKRGDRPEFSIGGRAVPVDVTDDFYKRSGGRRLKRWPFRY